MIPLQKVFRHVDRWVEGEFDGSTFRTLRSNYIVSNSVQTYLILTQTSKD